MREARNSGYDTGRYRRSLTTAKTAKALRIPGLFEQRERLTLSEVARVTPQAVVLEARPEIMVTHKPSHMFVTDLTVKSIEATQGAGPPPLHPLFTHGINTANAFRLPRRK